MMMSQRYDAGERGEGATPLPGQHEHTEHEPHLLQEAHDALGRERVSEHLEEAREHPEAAGPIEMEEVGVRNLAPQDPLREREHEAFLHRRSLRPQQAAERDQKQREEDEDGHDRPAVTHDARDDGESTAPRHRPVDVVGARHHIRECAHRPSAAIRKEPVMLQPKRGRSTSR